MYNGKNSPFIGCSQLYPKHYVSLTDYPIASDIKPTAHRILSLTHRKCWGNPIYGYFLLFYRYSHTIYLYNRKLDWCLIVHPIWLVWHTYISDPLIHPSTTYPTRQLRGIFLQKNNSKKAFSCAGVKIWNKMRMNLKHQKISLKKQVKMYLSKILR